VKSSTDATRSDVRRTARRERGNLSLGHRDRRARHRLKATAHVCPVLVEGDDPEAVALLQLRQRVHCGRDLRRDLALHATRHVEHEHVVGPDRDGSKVDARREDRHERALGAGGLAVANDLQAPLEVARKAVEEDQVLVEFGGRELRAHGEAPSAELRDGGSQPRHADFDDRKRALELQVEAQAGRELVSRPRRVARPAVLQRIEVAPHRLVDLQRLEVDEGHRSFGGRWNVGDGEAEVLVAVFRGEPRLAPRLLLVGVYLLRLCAGEHLAIHGAIRELDLHLRQRCVLRDRKLVDGVDGDGVWVREDLRHLRASEAVVQHDAHAVIDDLGVLPRL